MAAEKASTPVSEPPSPGEQQPPSTKMSSENPFAAPKPPSPRERQNFNTEGAPRNIFGLPESFLPTEKLSSNTETYPWGLFGQPKSSVFTGKPPPSSETDSGRSLCEIPKLPLSTDKSPPGTETLPGGLFGQPKSSFFTGKPAFGTEIYRGSLWGAPESPSPGEKPTATTERSIFSSENSIFGKSSLSADLTALSLQSRHKIIVGVDYGTTFTGASYVSSKATDISDIVVINSWPGPSRDTDTVFKTPSRIAYAAENARLSQDRWGFQVEPGMVSYSWTKLLLDQGTPLTQYDDSALEEASKIGIMRLPEKKTAVDVVGDYLSEVYQHILKTIGKSITEDTLRITPLEFWFTVPAIWSDRAKDATRKAARRAGFGGTLFRPGDKIFLIPEPEAAAIAVLRKYSSSTLGGSVKAGDGVLVCDCGGGTVDLTTYLVNEVAPLKFEELCTGMGGKCGSTAVDRNFYKLMSERFGEAFDKLPTKRKSPGSEFMKKFEILKRDFGVSDEQTSFELPLNMTVDNPDPKYFDEEDRLVIISSDDLNQIFDPVVDQILQLVKRQIEDAKEEAGRDIINRIILVGGFGDSEYLRKAFKSNFGFDGKIAITVPEIPQAAIVQGAALRGLEGIRSSTKRCRRHYGFSIDMEFRPGIDKDSNAYWDTYNDSKMVRDIMKWAIKKGQKCAEDHTEWFPLFWKKHPTSSFGPRISLYACDQTLAPERSDDKGVYKVGDIAVDASGVDFTKFDSKLINGARVYDVRLQLKVTFGAQEGLLKCEAISQGRRIGKTNIDFSTTKYY